MTVAEHGDSFSSVITSNPMETTECEKYNRTSCEAGDPDCQGTELCNMHKDHQHVRCYVLWTNSSEGKVRFRTLHIFIIALYLQIDMLLCNSQFSNICDLDLYLVWFIFLSRTKLFIRCFLLIIVENCHSFWFLLILLLVPSPTIFNYIFSIINIVLSWILSTYSKNIFLSHIHTCKMF